MKKTIVERHFDRVSASYDFGKNKYSFYYSNVKSLLKSLIGQNKNVLEFGCGTGDLLASLNPKAGYGVDISYEMVMKAKEKYADFDNLKFSKELNLNNKFKFDVIFMTDVIEHLENVEDTLKIFEKIMGPKTLLINTMANPLWELPLMLWEKVGWKMEEGPHYRIKNYELQIIMKKVGLKMVKHDYKLLIPIQIPFITSFANKYLEKYLKTFCFIEYFVAVKV